jgi:hypothetical protein
MFGSVAESLTEQTKLLSPVSVLLKAPLVQYFGWIVITSVSFLISWNRPTREDLRAYARPLLKLSKDARILIMNSRYDEVWQALSSLIDFPDLAALLDVQCGAICPLL